MRIQIGILALAAAGLAGCVSTYASDPVMGANASTSSEPQAFSVMMLDHPDEASGVPAPDHRPVVAGG